MSRCAQCVRAADRCDAPARVCAAAIDLGASSGRVMVGTYDARDGLNVREIHRFANGLVEDRGKLVWDIESIVREVRVGLSRAAELGATTCGIDTWGVDYGLIDADGRLHGAVVGYRDARTAGVADMIEREGLREDSYSRTGIPMLDINTLSQLVAQVRDEGPISGDLRLLMVPDLIAQMLTGSCATEPSIASTTQLMDAAVKQWDPAMLELAKIARSSMPVIEPLGSDAGAIADDIAAGMRMVRVCEHDTASAVASVELLPGDVFISCGTWSLVGVERDAPVLTKEAERANLSNETGAGNSTLLLANCTGLWIAQQLKPELEQEFGVDLSWEDIASSVASRDGASFVFDTEEPSLAQPGNMLEKLRPLARESGYEGGLGVADLFRAVYESLALRYLHVIELIENVTGDPCERIRLIGGGSQNAALCQLVADVCGRVVVAGPHEASAIGNLLVQMTAQGAFETLEEARAAVAPSWRPTAYAPRGERVQSGGRSVPC